MTTMAWSKLPEELVDSVADHALSRIDFVHIRSICQDWRSAVPTKILSAVPTTKSSQVATRKRSAKRFPHRFPIYLPFDTDVKRTFRVLYPTAFYRVNLPSSSKGWLIKTRQVSASSKHLLFPLSHQYMSPNEKTLDLLEVGVTEILQSHEIHDVTSISHDIVNYSFSVTHQRYNVRYLGKRKRQELEAIRDVNIFYEMSRVAFVEGMVFALYDNEIWWCKSGKGEDNRWKILESEISETSFVDIAVHKRQVYVLDVSGAIFWIKSSEPNVYQQTSPTPVDYSDELYHSEEKRLVEYCGNLCIIRRFYEKDGGDKVWGGDKVKTVNFKVYKMDQELMAWVEVGSLGDKTLIMAEDKCFSVLASDYYGCLENAIYFLDQDVLSVFTFDDKRIITKRYGFKGKGAKKNNDPSSSYPESCFDMFFSPFP